MFMLMLALAATATHAAEVSSNLTEMVSLYHSGDFDAALAVYARILKQTNPPPSEVQLVFIRVLIGQRKLDAAQRSIQDYARQNPQDYRPWFEWGVVRTRSCGGPDAAACLRRSIELNPNHAPSYLWLAQTCVRQQEKVQALLKVLELEDRDSETANRAASLLKEIREKERTESKVPTP